MSIVIVIKNSMITLVVTLVAIVGGRVTATQEKITIAMSAFI